MEYKEVNEGRSAEDGGCIEDENYDVFVRQEYKMHRISI